MGHRRDVRGALLVVSVCVVALLAGLPFAGADLVLNGGFEDVDISPLAWLVAPPGQLTNWTITPGRIDVADKAWWDPAEGDQSVDLNHGGPGTISQNLLTEAGATYQIDFALTGNWRGPPDTKSMQVWWDGNMVGQFDITEPVGWSTSNMNWQYYRISNMIASGSSTTLEFVSLTPGEGGPILDDVSVTPEPGTLALMALGLAGLVAARRRRKDEDE